MHKQMLHSNGQRGSTSLLLAVLVAGIIGSVLLTKHQQYFMRNKQMKALINKIENRSAFKNAFDITSNLISNGSLVILPPDPDIPNTVFYDDLGENIHQINYDVGDIPGGTPSSITMVTDVNGENISVQIAFSDYQDVSVNQKFVIVEASVPGNTSVKSEKAKLSLPEKGATRPYECEDLPCGGWTCPATEEEAVITLNSAADMRPVGSGGKLEDGKNYRLGADIDFGGGGSGAGSYANITLDGNGYEFKNYSNSDGLFTILDRSFLVNIRLDNFNITNSASSDTGSLVRRAIDACLYKVVAKNITVFAYHTYQVGGLIGLLETTGPAYQGGVESILMDSPSVLGAGSTGGVVGKSLTGLLKSVHAKNVDVSWGGAGSSPLHRGQGGLVGTNMGNIRDARVSGSVTGFGIVGGAFGFSSSWLGASTERVVVENMSVSGPDSGGFAGSITSPNLKNISVGIAGGPVTVTSTTTAGGVAPSLTCGSGSVENIFSGATVDAAAPTCAQFIASSDSDCVADSFFVNVAGGCGNAGFAFTNAWQITEAEALDLAVHPSYLPANWLNWNVTAYPELMFQQAPPN